MYQINEKLKQLKVNPFCNFAYDYAVVVAGNKDDYNCMTIGWGQLGTLWSRPIASVFIKPIRYTYKYMEENDYFTICFFDEKYKKDLAILGSKSGRDGDKVALTSLEIEQLDKGLSFKQAKYTIVCKKIYYQDLDIDKIPQDIKEHYYLTEAAHREYFGLVEDVITGE